MGWGVSPLEPLVHANTAQANAHVAGNKNFIEDSGGQTCEWGMPPLAHPLRTYMIPSGKYERKRSDSCPSHSRCCTGLSSSRVSSSTVLYAAVPYSSCQCIPVRHFMIILKQRLPYSRSCVVGRSHGELGRFTAHSLPLSTDEMSSDGGR